MTENIAIALIAALSTLAGSVLGSIITAYATLRSAYAKMEASQPARLAPRQAGPSRKVIIVLVGAVMLGALVFGLLGLAAALWWLSTQSPFSDWCLFGWGTHICL